MNKNIASILHEIRTPIQTLLGTAELLKETALDKEQQEYVRQIYFSADVLHNLVNDILDFEKMHSDKLNLEKIPCDLRSITEQVLDLVSLEAYKKGLELDAFIPLTMPEKVIGDPVRIMQILLNMVKNAVKFTEKGYIQVTISWQENEGYLFQVIDTGSGIPDDKKKLIFQEFIQATEETSRRFGGTGLGLSICSNLVSLMNGTIGVRDNPEGGSVFYFNLPLQPVSSKKIEEIPCVRKEIRILVVDDSPFQCKCLERKLLSVGAAVHTATSGAEALAKMKEAYNKQVPYDIVYIDLVMPVMTGWRLASEINKDKEINSAKLILMIPEGQLHKETKMKLLTWFNAYLYKPIKLHQFLEILTNTSKQLLELPPVDEKKSVNLSGKGITIMTVDDHPVNLKIMETHINSMGYKTITATTGTEAVEKALAHPEIQIIFMDMQLPDINGNIAAQKIRKNGYKNIIIACSANSDEELKKDKLLKNIDTSLEKPFTKQKLKETIEKYLNIQD